MATNDDLDPRAVTYDLNALGLPLSHVQVYRTDAGGNLAPQPDLQVSGNVLQDVQSPLSVTTYVIDR